MSNSQHQCESIFTTNFRNTLAEMLLTFTKPVLRVSSYQCLVVRICIALAIMLAWFRKSTQDIQRWMTLTERDSEPEFYLDQAHLKPGAEGALGEWASGGTSQNMWFRSKLPQITLVEERSLQ
jgi:hypothetical protein